MAGMTVHRADVVSAPDPLRRGCLQLMGVGDGCVPPQPSLLA